jgi:hypothetical protein
MTYQLFNVAKCPLPRCFTAMERVSLYFRRCKLAMTRFLAAMDRCKGYLVRRRAEMVVAALQWCIAADFRSLHRNNGVLQLNNGALQLVFND